LAGSGSTFAAPPRVTFGPSSTADQKLFVPSAKKPVVAFTAFCAGALLSLIVPSAIRRYFFRLPGQ
jgi:hypothetical protein